MRCCRCYEGQRDEAWGCQDPSHTGFSIKQLFILCLLWIKKVRTKDKTYIWVSVWWKTKNQIWEIYTPYIHCVDRETGTPKDKEEINKRDVCECDGLLCVFEVIDTPAKCHVRVSKQSCKQANLLILWGVRSTTKKNRFFIFFLQKNLKNMI